MPERKPPSTGAMRTAQLLASFATGPYCFEARAPETKGPKSQQPVRRLPGKAGPIGATRMTLPEPLPLLGVPSECLSSRNLGRSDSYHREPAIVRTALRTVPAKTRFVKTSDDLFSRDTSQPWFRSANCSVRTRRRSGFEKSLSRSHRHLRIVGDSPDAAVRREAVEHRRTSPEAAENSLLSDEHQGRSQRIASGRSQEATPVPPLTKHHPNSTVKQTAR